MNVNYEHDALVDIRSVSVNKNLSRMERTAEYVRQIKNSYRFKCGGFIINACFASDGVSLEERLQGVIR